MSLRRTRKARKPRDRRRNFGGRIGFEVKEVTLSTGEKVSAKVYPEWAFAPSGGLHKARQRERQKTQEKTKRMAAKVSQARMGGFNTCKG